MDQTQDSSDKKEKDHQLKYQPRRIFLGCFGVSVSPHRVKEKNRKRTISWLSLSKRSTKEIAQADFAASEKLYQRNKSFSMAKSSKKGLTKPPKLPPEETVSSGQTPAGDVVHGKIFKTRYETAQKINLGNVKSLSNLHSIKKEKTTFTEKESPEDEREISCRRGTAVFSHSISMSAKSTRKKPVAGGGGEITSLVKEDNFHENNDIINIQAGKFDTLVGMSIIMVTLLIVIVWGKLCAILCTSAWLYCYPLIKTKMIKPQVTSENSSKSCDLDLNSKEYKKKVVLEGFLERKHRYNRVGIS